MWVKLTKPGLGLDSFSVTVAVGNFSKISSLSVIET